MQSSLVARAIYDPAAGTLAVTFTTGRAYLYFDVPPALYAEFVAAGSKGQFFNAYIRDRFAYRELD